MVFFACDVASTPAVTETAGVYDSLGETAAPAGDSPGSGQAVETAAGNPPAATQEAAPSGATQAPAATAPPVTQAAPALPASGGEPADMVDPSQVSNLVDAELGNASGAEIANIDSLVLDRSTGQVAYLLLDTDDDIEDADRVLFIPWGALQVTDDVNDTLDRIIFTLDPATIPASPALVINDTFNFGDPAWDDAVAGYWSQAGGSLPNTGAAGSAGMTRLKDDDDLRLVSSQGAAFAEVKDVILDPASGQLRYVLAERLGGAGTAPALVPIPFEKFTWDPASVNTLALTVDPAVLNAAPGYPSEEAVPDTATPGWDNAVKQYWAGQ
jgi:hypothetical protein